MSQSIKWSQIFKCRPPIFIHTTAQRALLHDAFRIVLKKTRSLKSVIIPLMEMVVNLRPIENKKTAAFKLILQIYCD